ncbi:hypothetical protein [Streptomyces sp. BA2]|uniref:hypothetical protein n=1 Tax=Streptomyces sp. BA2 TaxID=436595 RepID=UPI001F44D90A|nr:hypothetical protein [Streptomyces sp. BA2]
MTAATLLAGLGPIGTAVAADRSVGPAAEAEETVQSTSGYHVNSYDVRLDYNPAKETLLGEATLDLVVKEWRDALDLRLQLPARSVQIDGKAATFSADKGTLHVKPVARLSPGRHVKVHVAYAGSPRRTLDDPGEDNLAWAATKDGGHYLALETAGVLFPANSDDADRSAVHLQARVPDGWTAISNGRAGTPVKDGDHKVYRWANREPMRAGYVHFGVGNKWTESDTKLPDGTPVHFVYGSGAEGRGRKLAEALGEAASWEASIFGKYRHDSLTVSFLDFEDPNVPNVTGWNTISMGMEYPGDAETQPVTQDILVHELAHTWLEAVQAKDDYVEETIPTYLQWAWKEKFRKADLVTMYRDKVKKIQWQHTNVYTTGDVAMYALRRLVGDNAFDRALKDWLPNHADRPTAWDAFRTSLEKHSGKDLKPFFAGWFPPEGTKPAYPGDDLVWPAWAKD